MPSFNCQWDIVKMSAWKFYKHQSCSCLNINSQTLHDILTFGFSGWRVFPKQLVCSSLCSAAWCKQGLSEIVPTSSNVNSQLWKHVHNFNSSVGETYLSQLEVAPLYTDWQQSWMTWGLRCLSLVPPLSGEALMPLTVILRANHLHVTERSCFYPTAIFTYDLI